ncbi:transposase [Allofournierella sp.]|uniref:transposase n=1 Tax=Allofournierella sp. TaxID=1940256 RepID=UPI003AB7D454
MSHSFTAAETSEIRTAYRQAKDPRAQIGILADLYACDAEDICQVLQIAKPEKSKRKSYNQAVRDQVVAAILVEGETQAAAAERFGVPAGNVTRWIKQAKAKQAEFMAYPEAPAEPAPAPAKEPVIAPARSGMLDRTLQELQRGADGMRAFVDNFAGIDMFSEDEWRMADLLCERATGFAAGFETALALAREGVK